MNINRKLVLATVLLAPCFVLDVVRAHGQEDAATPEQTTPQTEERHVTTGNEGLTLKERLQERKDKLQTRLDNAKTTRLQAQCKASQGRLGQLKQRIGTVASNRHTMYDKLVQRLETLSGNLKDHGLDVTAFHQQITELQAKTDLYQTSLAQYQEAVSDMADMDCAADPTGFQVSLEEARTLRTQTINTGHAIHAYLQDPIKKTLQMIRGEVSTHPEGSN